MLDWFFQKIYILFWFHFIFIFLLSNFFVPDINSIIISIYWVLLLPFKYLSILNIKTLSDKRLLYKKISLISIITLIWYLISWNIASFLLILLYIFCVFFKINIKNLYIISMSSFLLFFITYLLNFDTTIYSTYLIFSFYIILFLIIYYFSNLLFDLDKILSNNSSKILKIFLIFTLILLLYSLYFLNLIIYLPFMLLLCLFINNYNDNKWNILQINNNYFTDISIFGLFFIIFIPILNDYLLLENKNKILFITFISFFVTYTGIILILKKLKNKAVI